MACAILNQDDYSILTYRGLVIVLPKTANSMIMTELCGKKNDYCEVRGDQCILPIFQLVCVRGTSEIIGGGMPIVTKVVHGHQYLENGKVVLCWFGGGAANQADFQESLNSTPLCRISFLYVCKNNSYTETTLHIDRQPSRDIFVRGKAYN